MKWLYLMLTGLGFKVAPVAGSPLPASPASSATPTPPTGTPAASVPEGEPVRVLMPVRITNTADGRVKFTMLNFAEFAMGPGLALDLADQLRRAAMNQCGLGELFTRLCPPPVSTTEPDRPAGVQIENLGGAKP